MKKTCYWCKASYFSHGIYICKLGYECNFNGIPLEQCPKPTTNKKLCDEKPKMYYNSGDNK